MIFKTEEIKECLQIMAKVIKIDLKRPITNIAYIKIKNNEAEFNCTDNNDFYTIRCNVEFNGKSEISFNRAEVLELIAKQTVEKIKLSIKSNVLTIKGNGTYKFSIPLDENNEIIKLLPPTEGKVYTDNMDFTNINMGNLIPILNTNKIALPAYKKNDDLNFFFQTKEGIYTSDSNIIVFSNKTITDKEKNFEPRILFILATFSNFKCVAFDNVHKCIVSDKATFYIGEQLSSDFDTSTFKKLIDNARGSKVFIKIIKEDFINALNRIALFSKSYDRDTVNVVYGKEIGKATISDLNGIAVEELFIDNDINKEIKFTAYTSVLAKALSILQSNIKIARGDEYIYLTDDKTEIVLGVD